MVVLPRMASLQLRRARVRLQLVDTPDEAGAVEAAGRLDAERRLRLLARAAPDVRIADERDGSAEDLALPRGRAPVARRSSAASRTASVSQPPKPRIRAAEKRGLRASRRVPGQQLERVLSGGMVRAEAEEARDDLVAEAARRREPGVTCAVA